MPHRLNRSVELFSRAAVRIPGGVNSPVRAFRAVGGQPLFMERGEGACLIDVDGNRYLDLIGSWGPLLFGHTPPRVTEAVRRQLEKGTTFGAPTELEVEMAETLCRLVPSMQMVRLVSSGTEATMSAIRAARGFTGRSRIVKFEGHYHGHADHLLARAGSGVTTLGLPDSAGVPPNITCDTLTIPWNNLNAAEALFAAESEHVACVILEPIPGNMGCVPPAPGFLPALMELARANGALVIFDEVMSGFRVARGGAQEMFGLDPDLTTLGKVIGGGLPLAAYGGRGDVMERIAPSGPVYQAGTLSGNPLAVAAGLETLRMIEEDPALYGRLEAMGAQAEQGLREAAHAAGTPATINRAGSMFTLFFNEGPVNDYESARASDTARFGRFHAAMLNRGVYLPPSQFEAAFLSAAMSDADIERLTTAARNAIAE